MSHQIFRERLRPLARSLDACGLGLCCMVVLLVHLLWRVPMQSQNDMARQQIGRAETVWENRESIAAGYQQQVAAFEKLQEDSRALRRRVPVTLSESTFLAQFARLAETHRVQVAGFQPGSPLKWGKCQGQEVQVSLRSGYVDLCQFLEALNQQERLSQITDLRITAAAQSTGVQDVQLTVVLFARPALESNTVASR